MNDESIGFKSMISSFVDEKPTIEDWSIDAKVRLYLFIWFITKLIMSQQNKNKKI